MCGFELTSINHVQILGLRWDTTGSSPVLVHELGVCSISHTFHEDIDRRASGQTPHEAKTFEYRNVAEIRVAPNRGGVHQHASLLDGIDDLGCYIEPAR